MTEVLSPEATQASSREADYLERARSIASLIRDEAEAIERERTITKPVADALVELGLHGMLIPEDLGVGVCCPARVCASSRR
ncbi:hypothetical protein [Gordonia terrae]|nr:hypothetical protein [Gordonia terrae]